MNKWKRINESEECLERDLIDAIWMMLDDSKRWNKRWELYFKNDKQFRMENKDTGQWFTVTVKAD